MTGPLDTLFLLPAGFQDHGRWEYCPECAEINGLLAWFPTIRESLRIEHQPLAHPRPGLVALLGDGRWNCPTLVLAPDSPDCGRDIPVANGRRHLGSARAIGAYYAARFGVPWPRGA